jgi:hypothetical protein
MHSMIKQILDFNKKAFDDSFNAVVTVQEHAEKMARVFWEKSSFFPEEGKKVVEDWVLTYKNGLNEYRANVDSRFKLVESYLLSAADQLNSSFNTVVKPAGANEPADDQSKKQVAVELKKAAVRKPAAKKEKISGKKTNK